MERKAFEKAVKRAEKALKTGQVGAVRQELDGLPARWSCAPEVFRLRNALLMQGKPAFMAQKLRPEDANRLSGLLNARQYDTAIAMARALAARLPLAASPLEALAIAFNATRRFGPALDAAREALIRAPQRPTLYRELALSLYETGAFEALRAPAEAAAKALPKDPQAQRLAAVAATLHGDKPAARDRFGRLATLMPTNGAAHRSYGELHSYRDANDPHLARMLEILDEGRTTPEETLEFHFALGKAFDEIGDTDTAFDHYARGNALKKAHYGLSVTPHIQDAEALRDRFAGFAPSPAADAAGPAPILVMGLPRSATTLTESILEAHPQVGTAGEAIFLRQHLLPALRADTPPTPERLSELRDGYLETLRQAGGGKPFVVDKMPSNFLLAGYVARLIPEARLVATDRDPVALGWSNFRQCFMRTSNSFSYDFGDIAAYMALYRDMLAFWEERGMALNRLSYSDLVEAPEPTVRALLQALGLPWHDACLKFPGSDRVVATASAVQVRQGIVTGRDDAWKKYADHLQPLIENLQTHGLV